MMQRQKFLHDGNGELDKPPDPDTILDHGFKYSLYVRKIQAQRLAAMLELPVLQWFILFLVTALVLLSTLGADGSWEFVLWLWPAVGLVLVIIQLSFWKYLKL